MSELSPRNGIPGDAPSVPEASLGVPRALIRLMRPVQWTKNLLLFAALVFAKKMFVGESLALATLGFASFCLASSSVYVVNDLLDAERDRQHPEKRHRPIAAGAVSIGAREKSVRGTEDRLPSHAWRWCLHRTSRAQPSRRAAGAGVRLGGDK